MNNSIIKAIASSIFGIKGCNTIKDAGVIPHAFTGINSHCTGGMWDARTDMRVWGYSASLGFVELPQVLGVEWNEPDGVPQVERGARLYEVEGVELFTHFLVFRESSYNCASMGEFRYTQEWLLYTTPNFRLAGNTSLEFDEEDVDMPDEDDSLSQHPLDFMTYDESGIAFRLI